MTEYIGSRISLISKRDIRYVGTLHEISSENSTVALEQVVSFGTEGRRPDDEVPPSDNVYEYIVFRGSDVKDLRIEEGPKENTPPQPPVPDDPAILGSARRPVSTNVAKPSQDAAAKTQLAQPQPQTQNQHPLKPTVQPQPQHPQQRQQPPPHFQQQPPYPYPYPPRFGPQGFPPGPGFPGMPYGAPPGWYPPPGYVYPPMPPGQFHPNQMPIGPPGQQPRQQQTQPTPVQVPMPAPISTGSAVTGGSSSAAERASPLKPTATVKLPSVTSTPVPPPTIQNAPPPPPTESKPDVAAALAPPAPTAPEIAVSASKAVPTGPKSGRIIPAIPLPSPNIRTSSTVNGTLKAASGKAGQVEPAQEPAKLAASKPAPIKTKSIEEATRDARAAVAAAMAKLPPAPGHKKQGEGSAAMDNLTKKVNEMRTNDNIRTRQPGTGGYAAGHRGGERGQHRGGRRHSEQKKVNVPTTDYDFASANAKFNKQDLVKEAIASGSPLEAEEPIANCLDNTINGEKKNSDSSVAYNKSSSFFDNISSESKDRTEEGGNRLGGREFRSEERQKNLETFGQGSVDNGYRGGYSRGGRGRGRGYGRGRGTRGSYESRGGRNSVRGGRGAVATEG